MTVYRVFTLAYKPSGSWWIADELYWKQWFKGSRYACERYVARKSARLGSNPLTADRFNSFYITSLSPRRFREIHGRLRWPTRKPTVRRAP